MKSFATEAIATSWSFPPVSIRLVVPRSSTATEIVAPLVAASPVAWTMRPASPSKFAARGSSWPFSAGGGSSSGAPYTFAQPVVDQVIIATVACSQVQRKPCSHGHFTDMWDHSPTSRRGRRRGDSR